MKCARQAGFSLVELTVVILLVGILSAVVVPRFFSTSTYQVRGLADGIVANLQYARRLALGDSTVSVTFAVTSSTYSVLLDGVVTTRPDGSGNYPVTLADLGINDVTLSPAITFTFDALGGVASGDRLTVSGSEFNIIICVEETGYVHIC